MGVITCGSNKQDWTSRASAKLAFVPSHRTARGCQGKPFCKIRVNADGCNASCRPLHSCWASLWYGLGYPLTSPTPKAAPWGYLRSDQDVGATKTHREDILFAWCIGTEVNPWNIWGSADGSRTQVSSQQRCPCSTVQAGAKHSSFSCEWRGSRALPVPPWVSLSGCRGWEQRGSSRHPCTTTTPTSTAPPVLRPVLMKASEMNVFALCPCSWHNYKIGNSATSTKNSDTTDNRIWLLSSHLLCCHLCLRVLQPSPKWELHRRLTQHLCLLWLLSLMSSTTIFLLEPIKKKPKHQKTD